MNELKLNMELYKKAIEQDIETNPKYAHLINSIFFSRGFDIQSWIKQTEVRSFSDFSFVGKRFPMGLCSRDTMDTIEYYPFSDEFSDRYYILKKDEYPSYESAAENYPRTYFFLDNNYISRLDEVFLKKLGDYVQESETCRIKKLSASVDILIDNSRDISFIGNIFRYRLPRLKVRKDGREIQTGYADVRNFLFLPESSFLFFYFDCHNYLLDEEFKIQDFKPKYDEPVIYHFDKENKYVITNRWENIDRYNKYIQIIISLSVHYLRIFENWIRESLVE